MIRVIFKCNKHSYGIVREGIIDVVGEDNISADFELVGESYVGYCSGSTIEMELYDLLEMFEKEEVINSFEVFNSKVGV